MITPGQHLLDGREVISGNWGPGRSRGRKWWLRRRGNPRRCRRRTSAPSVQSRFRRVPLPQPSRRARRWLVVKPPTDRNVCQMSAYRTTKRQSPLGSGAADEDGNLAKKSGRTGSRAPLPHSYSHTTGGDATSESCGIPPSPTQRPNRIFWGSSGRAAGYLFGVGAIFVARRP